jgi:hypothetical protein
LVLSVHTGWGSAQGRFFEFKKMLDANPSWAEEVAKGDVEKFIKKTQEARGVTVDIAPRRLFWQLILGGVFDRYPGLKIAFGELRSDWLPDTLSYLDERFTREGRVSKLKPSEYFQRQGFITPSAPRPSEIAQRGRIGINRMMLGIDYPHPEGTWPNTLDWLRGVLADVSENEARRFAGENAVECFGLDGAKLRRIAARIGPDVGDIIGGHKQIAAPMIDHFHARAGYKSPAEVVDLNLLRETVDADLAAVRT